MAAGGWLSHYNAAGLAPYERFAAAGGTGHVMENVFRSQTRPAAEWVLHDPWPRFDVREAQDWFMSSRGHRATILDPHRARIGVGIAVDRARSAVYVVQELVAEAAILSSHPGMVLPGQDASVSGQVRVPGARPLMAVLSREPGGTAVGRERTQPPGGAYPDGGPESLVIPPWAIRWNSGDRSFGVDLRMSRSRSGALVRRSLRGSGRRRPGGGRPPPSRDRRGAGPPPRSWSKRCNSRNFQACTSAEKRVR